MEINQSIRESSRSRDCSALLTGPLQVCVMVGIQVLVLLTTKPTELMKYAALGCSTKTTHSPNWQTDKKHRMQALNRIVEYFEVNVENNSSVEAIVEYKPFEEVLVD